MNNKNIIKELEIKKDKMIKFKNGTMITFFVSLIIWLSCLFSGASINPFAPNTRINEMISFVSTISLVFWFFNGFLWLLLIEGIKGIEKEIVRWKD